MKTVVFSIVALLLISNLAFSQRKTTSNKNLPKKQVAKVKTTDFLLEEDGFKISFPLKPTKTSELIDASFGKTNFTNFRLETSSATFSISYYDYPAPMKNPAEIKLIFEQIKNLIPLEGALLSEKDVYYEEYLGREFISEGDNEETGFTNYRRLFVIEQRSFLLRVALNGKLNQYSQTVKAANKTKTDKFFNSFSITKLPKPKSVAVELPSNLGIIIKNSGFESTVLGFSLELPANWISFNEEQIEFINLLDKQIMREKFPNNQTLIEENYKNRMSVFIVSRLPFMAQTDAMFSSAVSKTSIPNFLPLEAAKNSMREFSLQGALITQQPSLVKFGGVDFGWFEMSFSSANLKQRFYVTNRKGLALQFFVLYRNERELNLMLKSLQTINFSEAK